MFTIVSEMNALIKPTCTGGTNDGSYYGFLISEVQYLNVLLFWSISFVTVKDLHPVYIPLREDTCPAVGYSYINSLSRNIRKMEQPY